MITSKQRAYLRKQGNTMDAIFHIGKAGLTPEVVNAIRDALEAREIVKVDILKNCLYDKKEIAVTLSERTRSEIVQIIGRKVTIYKKSDENPRIILP
jgi:RNA-binding protein